MSVPFVLLKYASKFMIFLLNLNASIFQLVL